MTQTARRMEKEILKKVSPQCPEDSMWGAEMDALKLLLDEIVKSHNVDTSRVYLTRLSMGGYGTWHLASILADSPRSFRFVAEAIRSESSR